MTDEIEAVARILAPMLEGGREYDQMPPDRRTLKIWNRAGMCSINDATQDDAREAADAIITALDKLRAERKEAERDKFRARFEQHWKSEFIQNFLLARSEARAGELERWGPDYCREHDTDEMREKADGGWVRYDQAAATIASLRAELARAEERGARMGIEAAAETLNTAGEYWAGLREGALFDRQVKAIRALDPAAIIRANAPRTLADSDGADGA